MSKFTNLIVQLYRISQAIGDMAKIILKTFFGLAFFGLILYVIIELLIQSH